MSLTTRAKNGNNAWVNTLKAYVASDGHGPVQNTTASSIAEQEENTGLSQSQNATTISTNSLAASSAIPKLTLKVSFIS
jgi:hypothetical protein